MLSVLQSWSLRLRPVAALSKVTQTMSRSRDSNAARSKLEAHCLLCSRSWV